jgi:hypothetical protein
MLDDVSLFMAMCFVLWVIFGRICPWRTSLKIDVGKPGTEKSTGVCGFHVMDGFSCV